MSQHQTKTDKVTTPEITPEKAAKVGAPTPDSIASTYDEYMRAVSYSRRNTHPYPVLVTEDLFDVVTNGDTHVPFFHFGDGTPAGKAITIVAEPRKEQAFELLAGGKRIL